MVRFIGYSTLDIDSPNDVKKQGNDLIKRDLKNEFMTRKGERPMNAEYGSIIWDMLYEPQTQENRDIILSDCNRIINNEPRVRLLSIELRSKDHEIIVDMILEYVTDQTPDRLFLRFIGDNE